MIFLTATGWPVNWSRAELSGGDSGQLSRTIAVRAMRSNDIPDKAEGAHAHGLQVRIPRIQILAKGSAAGQSQAMRTGL